VNAQTPGERGPEPGPAEASTIPDAKAAPLPPVAAAADEGEWDSYRSPLPTNSEPAAPLTDDSPPWAGAAGALAPVTHPRHQGRALVREVVETGLLALLVFLAVRASFQNYRVHGHSMDPTLEDGEFLLVNRLEYAQVDVGNLARFIPFFDESSDKKDVFHGPQRGDIVILEDPRNPAGDRLVKRVIGLPGEKFEIANGVAYVNGRALHEPYLTTPWTGSTPAIVIPAGEFFVMGDNRNNSDDSRFLGLIPRDLIIGKAMVAFWPKEKFGFAPNEAPTLDANVTR
jgi:signal peptidase I